jgi:hypothetical protein
VADEELFGFGWRGWWRGCELWAGFVGEEGGADGEEEGGKEGGPGG